MGRRNVLVIEDERDIAELLALHLRDLNCEVTLAADGHEGMRQAFARNWDLVILDLRLPGPDGLSICRSLRRESRYVPILMLTSKSSELDRVLGLELGADDYVTKPFSVSELMARVKAIFRRVESLEKRYPGGGETLSAGPLDINTSGREVMLDSSPISLTAREFDLLLELVRQNGAVVSRIELMKTVWGHSSTIESRTIDTHVAELRRKLDDDPSASSLIATVRKIGYRIVQQAGAGTA